MSMQSGLGRRAAGARRAPTSPVQGLHLHCGRFGALLLALATAACSNLGQLGQLGQLIEGRRATVGFESIDGPPPAVFHRFVRALKEEAGARQITVVTSGDADYRLRGYLAAHVVGGKTSITWAWDVYGAGERRAFRLRGEDTAGAAAGANAWAAADDQALRRIAQKGLEQLATFMASAPRPSATAEAAPPPSSPPPRRSSTFAWLDDWAPEAHGILRLLGRESQPEIVTAAASADPPGSRTVPLPRHRPASSAAVLALASSD
jgi:hypothetical protein